MLKLQNIEKVFNRNTVNENRVFSDFSLTIRDEDFITVIGSNGAGKSTLMNIISGKLEIDKGSITINNKEISRMPEYKRTKFIGRVFQDPSHGVSTSMTVLENLSMAYNKGKNLNLFLGISKKNTEYFKELLSSISLGLENKLQSKAGLLSGGQRQALSLIMATLSKPDILLLDEHTAALDPKASEKILELTKQVVEEKKITTLMITHNLKEALNLGNRLIMIHQGEILLDIKGKEKSRLTIQDLLTCFERTQSRDLISDVALFA